MDACTIQDVGSRLGKAAYQQPVRSCDAGLRDGVRVKMLASKAADVAAVQAARDEPRAPSFDHELRRELRRFDTLTPLSRTAASSVVQQRLFLTGLNDNG
jgi:hypothetical protein